MNVRMIFSGACAVLLVACGRNSTGPQSSTVGRTYCLDDSTLVHYLRQPAYKWSLASIPGTGNTRYPYQVTLWDDGRITGGGYYASDLLEISDWDGNEVPDTIIIRQNRWLLPDSAKGMWGTRTDSLGERLWMDFAQQTVVEKGTRFNVWWWEGIDVEWGVAARHSVPSFSGFKTSGTTSFTDYDGSITVEHTEVAWVICEPKGVAQVQDPAQYRGGILAQGGTSTFREEGSEISGPGINRAKR